MAQPTEDRWHRSPTALMGGIAIFAGTLAGWMLVPSGGLPWALVGGGTLLFLSGLADDLWGLPPVAKLVVQIGGATVLLSFGWNLAPAWPAWISIPLTYFWIVGITNAVNLLDNMDGLAAGIAAIAASTVALLALAAGAWPGAAPALALAGAAGGFLVYNFQPARIFMGDSGALFLGFSISGLALSQPGAGASGTTAVLAVPAALMAVPILDTTLVTVKRIVSGRPVTEGGRDHSSHRLVFLGLSERRAALTLYGVAAAFSLLAVGLQILNVYLTLAVAALAAVGLAVFGVFLAQVHVSSVGDRSAEHDGGPSPDAVALRAVIRNKREIAALIADLTIVVACFVVAHYLRFETGLSPQHTQRMIQLLPAVVLVKIGTLYVMGVYRGLLRYAGSVELLRVARASTIASAALIVGLVFLYRFEGFSRSVFIIDWLLATLALAALRGAFRGLRGYFASRRGGTTRVLLYGAGDAGFLALREIRQNPELDLMPVGFLDDDPGKQGHAIGGVKILGGRDSLGDVCERLAVDDVVLTFNAGADLLEAVQDECSELGVRCRVLRISFEDASVSVALPD